MAEICLKLTLLHLGDLRSECGYSGISSTPSANDLSQSRSLFLFCWMFAKTSAMTKNSMSYLFLLGLHCPRQLCWVSHKLTFWWLFFFFFWLGLKILTLVFQLQSSLIIYKTYCLEFLRICYPGLRRGIHAFQSSTLWSYGPHSREFSEDKSSLSHLSNLLFSSSFNTLNGNGIEGVDLKKKKKHNVRVVH